MKRFSDNLIKRGLASVNTPSGSDCVLIQYGTTVHAASAADLYVNRENLNLEFKDIYESRSGANWAAKIMKQPDNVNVFKVNSYRVDFDGPIGLQFVETKYGSNHLQIFLPYNYTDDELDMSYPAFIINKELRRVVISYPRTIENTLMDCDWFFEGSFIYEANANEENKENYDIHLIDIGDRHYNFNIIDARSYASDRPKHWGTFEHPSKDLKMLIRLLIRAGWFDDVKLYRKDVFSIKDLGIEEYTNNVLGFEVINGEIKRFTKYSEDIWVEIPVAYGGIKFIKPKEQLKYFDKYDGYELTADVVVKRNSPDKGVTLFGFNLENNYVFQTIKYNVLDVLMGRMPQYEVEAIWPCDEPEHAEEPDEAKTDTE